MSLYEIKHPNATENRYELLQHNKRTIIDNAVTVDDVLLQPSRGIIESRSDFNFNRGFLMNAPMDCVMDFPLWLKSDGMVNVLPRRELPKLFEWTKDESVHDIWHTIENKVISIGLSDEFPESFIRELYEYNRDYSYGKIGRMYIMVDVAHGWSIQAEMKYKEIRNLFEYNCIPVSIISGSIATPDAVELLESGLVDFLRVGIGPGSACQTRIVTGVGVPQLTAVASIAYRANRFLTTKPRNGSPKGIIADGGIRTYGDICKYLAAGATHCMMGRMYAGCEDAAMPGVYRGQASTEYQLDVKGKVSNIVPEGVSVEIPTNGKYIKEVNEEIKRAVASAGSYLGLSSISDFGLDRVPFIRITPSGMYESKPMTMRE